MDATTALIINSVGVWLPMLAAGAAASAGGASRAAAGAALPAIGLTAVNSLVHIGLGLARQAYNPGLLSALAFPAWAAASIRALAASSSTPASALVAEAAAIGVAVHAVLAIMGHRHMNGHAAGAVVAAFGLGAPLAGLALGRLRGGAGRGREAAARPRRKAA